MKLRFFDFEVTPNWWLCVFGDLPEDVTNVNEINETIKDTFVSVHSDLPNCRDLCMSMMKEDDVCNVGYNIKGYDLMIANGVYQGFSPQQIKMINDIIINPSMAFASKEHLRMKPFASKRISGVVYLDLFDSSDGTLKDKEATLELSILESSVDFNKEDLTAEDKADLDYYCRHDVYASMVWYLSIVKPFVESKLAVCRAFNMPIADGYRCTNAQLVGKTLHAKRTTFVDAEKTEITLIPKIRDYVYDNIPSKIVDHVLTHTDVYDVQLFNNDIIFADGGIHSTLSLPLNKKEQGALHVDSDDEYVLINVDASSYYPGIMIFLDTLSRSIADKQKFIDVYNNRIAIKHKKNKTKDDNDLQLAYKLILNTTYGASGCEFLDLCDKYHRSKTCRYGQLLLIALGNKLYKNVPNLSVIQTNTDGILVYCRRADIEVVRNYANEWSKVTGIGMDLEFVDRIWQRDVNNYLLVKEGGKIKRKGGWLIDDYFKPGYIKIAPLQAYACGKAAIKFLNEGADIIETLVNNTKLSDFAITCKKGPSYRGVIQRFADGREETLFKSNRVYASKNQNNGRLYKVKMFKGNLQYTQMPSTPEHCALINDDLSKYNFNEIRKDLDYMYYYSRTLDLLDLAWFRLSKNSLNRIKDYDFE